METVNFDEQEGMEALNGFQEAMSEHARQEMMLLYGSNIGTAWMTARPPEVLVACLKELGDFLNDKQWDHRVVTTLCCAVIAQNITNRALAPPDACADFELYEKNVDLTHLAASYILSRQMLGYMSMQPDAPQALKDAARASGEMYGSFDPEK